MDIKLNYFEKFYVCRKCGNHEIKIFTKKIGGSNSCYDCDKCFNSACNPRKMYKLNPWVNPEDIIQIRNELVDSSSNQGNTLFVGYIARIVEMGNKLLNNECPEIMDIKKLTYRNKQLLKR